MAVSKRLRYEVLRRDSNTCRYCGGSAPDVVLTVDHVVPTALGGSDDPSNLVAACKDCNAGKSASSPDAALVADVDQRAVEWGQAMELAIEQRAAEWAAERKRVARFDRRWRTHVICGGYYTRDLAWKGSVARFMAAGLDDQFLADAIDIAVGSHVKASDVWRYFCGICWREIDKIRERTAAAIPAAPSPISPSGLADSRLPYGPGFHPGFDVLNLAEGYIMDLVEHVQCPDEVGKWASRGFWEGMQDAYATYMKGQQDRAASDDDAVSEAFSNSTAWYLAQVWTLCGAGQVSDGEK